MDERILICGTNWLGDGIMAMPALQLLKQKRPDCHVTLLVKDALVPLWRMQPAADEVVGYRPTARGTVAAVSAMRRGGYARAVVMPNSFRSALIPFLARVPTRVGRRGHQRSWLLTQVLKQAGIADNRHQAWEYMELLGLTDEADSLDVPRLSIPGEAADRAKKLLGDTSGVALVGILPGAARGPAKRWPVDHFAELARSLVQTKECRIVLLGTGAERDLCMRVAGESGVDAMNLAGETSLPGLAAVLGQCRVVVSNDSGGMHLAAAAGARVVAVFGLTDPKKTGPLGRAHRIIRNADVCGARDISRDAPRAIECLESIEPARVFEAVAELL